MGYVAIRMLFTRFRRGPIYDFALKYSKDVIEQSYKILLKPNIKMPIDRVVPFNEKGIAEAIHHLTSHQEKGRIIIYFES